jgi:hypothetical protein
MYIRRKVFSVAIDETTGEEKLFSTTEVSSKKDNKAAKAAAAAGAVTLASGATIYGAKKLGEKLDKKGKELVREAGITPGAGEKFAKGQKLEKAGKVLQKPAEKIMKIVKIVKK